MTSESTDCHAPSQIQVLDRIFQGLKSDDAEVRARSAFELQAFLSHPTDASQADSDDADLRWTETHLRTFALVHTGRTTAEKFGAILAIDRMLNLSISNNDLFRSYNCAKALLPDCVVPEPSARIALMRAAASILGRIVALLGPTFGQHFMDFEVQSALAHLNVDDWGERYAGLLILSELATKGREWFAPHVTAAVLEALTVVREGLVRDSAVPEMEEGAKSVTSACLEIMKEQHKQ
ncbi:hypothetical protein ACG7TL_001333 [Trametes sanguinea]